MKEPDVSDQEDLRPTLLIVDDSGSNQELLVSLLKQDYRLKVAGNRQSALDLAQSSPYPDLILLDVDTPEMDG